MDLDLPTYDVFLLTRDIQHHFAQQRTTFRALSGILDPSVLRRVDVHHRHEGDTALLRLFLDRERLSRSRMDFLIEHASSVGATVIDPSTLPGRASRMRFYDEYVQRFEAHLLSFPTLDGAMRGLARLIGLETTPPGWRNAQEPSHLAVRFRRGETWLAGRACCLTADGIYIAAGGAPRAGDVTDIEIALTGEPISGERSEGAERHQSISVQLVVRATVTQPTPSDVAGASGASGFGARFLLDDAQRAQLSGVIAAMASRGEILAQPPRRRDVRYPLRWPIRLRRPDGVVLEARALDVSAHGLFLSCAADEQPLDYRDEVELEIPLDVDAPPVVAHASVMRALDPRGPFTPGFGLSLDATAAFAGFVQRVARRGDHLVIVGAGEGRVDRVVDALVDTGYSVIRARDPIALIGTLSGARAPDVVVLDESLEGSDRVAQSITRSLATRLVPTLRTRNASPADVRRMVDAALLS